jgi:hypothetical protein
MIVLADGRENLGQIVLQSEVALDEVCLCIFELKAVTFLAYLENLFSDDAVPPTIFFVPSECLSAAESEIQIEWS